MIDTQLDTGTQNELWAKLIIDQLVQCGVRYFCVSPGSRSSALAIAISAHPEVEKCVHFDERGMAFHALGYALGSHTPVALLVTTGTAAGNLLPAIMEASLSRVPLIILTADRPPELRDVGSNQTADLVKLFSGYVRYQVDLPCSDPALPPHYLATILSHAVFRATQTFKGPVHLNCMFREPLFSETPVTPVSTRTTVYEQTVTLPSRSVLEKWAKTLSSIEKGVIVLGACASSNTVDAILRVSEALQWPILADILSPLRTQGPHPQVIAHYDLLLKQDAYKNSLTHPQAVLHLGDRFVSKTLLQWLKSVEPSLSHYYHVADNPTCYDPNHQITHRLVCDPIVFCEQLLSTLSLRSSSGWMQKWQSLSEITASNVQSFFEDQPTLSEPGVVYEIASRIKQDWAVFLSNSMPIRDADMLFFPPCKTQPVFCNRGVSGIDGNIATAIGIAQGTKKPILALLGDLASLHDLNSLAQLKNCHTPVIFLVFNNRGGGIFSFLSISKRQEMFEAFAATSHDLTFEAAATMFGLPYLCPSAGDDWQAVLSRCLEKGESQIIEICTNRDENFALHQQLYQNKTGQ